MRGGPQLASSGVVLQQSAKVQVGLEAIETEKALLNPSPADEELGSRTLNVLGF
jgi:hypothetical protein